MNRQPHSFVGPTLKCEGCCLTLARVRRLLGVNTYDCALIKYAVDIGKINQ